MSNGYWCRARHIKEMRIIEIMLEEPLYIIWFTNGCPFFSHRKFDWGTAILSSGNIYNTTCKRIFWPDSNKTTLDFFLTLPITNKCLYNTINGRWGNQDFTPWATLSLWYTLSTEVNAPSGQHRKEMLPLDSNGRKCSIKTALKDMIVLDCTAKHHYKIIYVIDYIFNPLQTRRRALLPKKEFRALFYNGIKT